MDLISEHLAEVPVVVTAAAVLGRALAQLAREVRLALLNWLALRGTRPDERSEIIQALTGSSGQVERAAMPDVGSSKAHRV